VAVGLVKKEHVGVGAGLSLHRQSAHALELELSQRTRQREVKVGKWNAASVSDVAVVELTQRQLAYGVC
jgi:hypothetical protein